MTKWHKETDQITGQVQQHAISDELGELWRSNGNENISDEPWPDTPIVQVLLGLAEVGPAFREIKDEINAAPVQSRSAQE